MFIILVLRAPLQVQLCGDLSIIKSCFFLWNRGLGEVERGVCYWQYIYMQGAEVTCIAFLHIRSNCHSVYFFPKTRLQYTGQCSTEGRRELTQGVDRIKMFGPLLILYIPRTHSHIKYFHQFIQFSHTHSKTIVKFITTK